MTSVVSSYGSPSFAFSNGNSTSIYSFGPSVTTVNHSQPTFQPAIQPTLFQTAQTSHNNDPWAQFYPPQPLHYSTASSNGYSFANQQGSMAIDNTGAFAMSSGNGSFAYNPTGGSVTVGQGFAQAGNAMTMFI